MLKDDFEEHVFCDFEITMDREVYMKHLEDYQRMQA